MEYGYIRVSTKEQNEQRQLIAMREFGIAENRVYMDKQSGKDFERKNYKRLIRKLKKDDTLVVKSSTGWGGCGYVCFLQKVVCFNAFFTRASAYNMVKFNKPFALRNMHIGNLRKNNCVSVQFR